MRSIVCCNFCLNALRYVVSNIKKQKSYSQKFWLILIEEMFKKISKIGIVYIQLSDSVNAKLAVY